MKISPKTSGKNPKPDNGLEDLFKEANELGGLEDLLHPSCLDAFKAYKSGKKVTFKNTNILEIPWSSETLEQIEAFLRTGQFENLIALLMANPQTIAHPIIFKQILHLRNQARFWNLKELDPCGTKHQAHDILESLLSGWVSRMLPGYTIAPKKVSRRRGPKTNFTPFELVDLVMAFYTLLGEMEPEKGKFPEGEFEIKKNESKSAFVVRAAVKIVQELHKKAKVEEGEAVADILPLDDKIAQSISRHAIEKNNVSQKNYKVSKRELLYALFAHYHYEGCPPGSLEGIIERAEADHPQFIKSLHLQKV